jgi:hypothetical protein
MVSTRISGTRGSWRVRASRVHPVAARGDYCMSPARLRSRLRADARRYRLRDPVGGSFGGARWILGLIQWARWGG